MSRRRREQRGAVAVEFGIIAPLLLMLVMGIIDFGWMLLNANIVNNTARDAARVASLSGTFTDIDGTVDSELADAGLDVTQVTSSITCTNTSGSNCDGTEASYNTNAVSGSAVVVTVTYTHEWITPFGSLCTVVGGDACTGDTIQIQRTSTMVRE